ncbi:MAG TPA: PAS domain-containing protein, partial [Pseudolabrys sp.]|nr:PAS domain-containing protein [Pseudolabrys sp.]
MTRSAFSLSYLSDRRLAAHALSPMPAWLWRIDGSRVLWANPTAAAIFNAPSPAALATRDFAAAHPAAAQIARLAETLPVGGTPRLERLRGFGAGVGVALTCLCSRVTLEDNKAAILVVATERAGPALSLPERVRRLLIGGKKPAAAFSADGELIEASAGAHEFLGSARDLISLGAQQLAKDASQNGHAEGRIAEAEVRIDRLGAGPTVVLLATFSAVPAQVQEPPQRRLPLRFVWRIDTDGIFTIPSDAFVRLAGSATARILGKPWPQVAQALGFADGPVSQALATRETWNGVSVQWPVEAEDEPLIIEMSGLPVRGPDSTFGGYRGFGVCRDLDRLAALEAKRAKTAERA